MNSQPESISCSLCNKTNTEFYASAKDVEYFTSEDSYYYFLCKECEVLFIHPVPSDKLDVIYPANYYSFQDEKKGFAFKIKNYLDKKFFKKIFREIEPATISILDIGGGTGWLLNEIKKYENRVRFTQVVDINEEAGDQAKSAGHEYFCGTIEQFQTEAKFDVILLLNLIEHVQDPLETLKKCRALLKPNGIIILKTPNYLSLDAKIFRDKNWGGYHCPRHWTIFNKSSFTNTASNAGLRIKKFYYTQGAPFWTVNVLYWLYSKKLIQVGRQRPLVNHPLFGVISSLFALFDFLRKPFAPLSQMFFILTK
ncbi:MAG: class I SAM-dependent methyltransferase [Bacteroidetes bacterium]|nr:MAG: class I SAM-dependent methyltransferase [Bacteroidota bacterium]